MGVYPYLARVGERTHEENDLYIEMKESEVINEQNLTESKVTLVYGWMNAPLGARMRVGLTALTIYDILKKSNDPISLFQLSPIVGKRNPFKVDPNEKTHF
ncbi:hypothetical protein Ddye_002833 [Dipteronia dyeriana]|uniref:H(+)-transporting two-sector ATPase n=1 Tax=Dipteronia dyeriana TaxID=168575 RepID=A0AAD9XR51_9ROSI|nr:hypothetical protein Ddye_002833 [Dipteronia dyeriana]